MIDLRHGDCIEIMKTIPDGSIDCVLTDPPYGTTACKWDSVIPFDLMWEQLKRITKPNGAIVLFGSEPFSSALRMSNIKNYKYDWIWQKSRPTGFLNVSRRPMRDHETVSVFSKAAPLYLPQGVRLINKGITGGDNRGGNTTGTVENKDFIQKYTNHPRTVLKFDSEASGIHPTQKPVPLMAYLVRTYTQKGETVLDFTMGSGSTGVACVQEARAFIGIERDDVYFKAAQERITDAARQGSLF